jgi:hypothetical protein
MPTLVSPSASVSVSIVESNTGLGVGSGLTASLTHAFTRSLSLAVGASGSGNVDTVYSSRQSIVNASPLDLDVRGTLTSRLDGTTVNFPLIVGILIVNNSTTAAETLSLGVGTNPVTSWMSGTTPAVIIGAGGFLFLTAPVAGYATTAGTADIVRIAANSGTIVTDIVIFGRAS